MIKRNKMIMRFEEFVAEKLLYTRVYEMAHDRDKANKLIMSMAAQIYKHLIMIHLYGPTDQDFNHWKSELNNKFLNYINNIILKNGKKLKFNDYRDWMYGSYDIDDYPDSAKEKISNNMKWIRKEKVSKTHQIDFMSVSEIFDELERIYPLLARDLSKGDFKDINDYLRKDMKT